MKSPSPTLQRYLRMRQMSGAPLHGRCSSPGSATSASSATTVSVPRSPAGWPAAARTRCGRVRVVDYGIRGMHLAYDLLDGYDALVLVDARARGGAPGQSVLEVGPTTPRGEVDAHGMDPVAVFATPRGLGGTLPPTYWSAAGRPTRAKASASA